MLDATTICPWPTSTYPIVRLSCNIWGGGAEVGASSPEQCIGLLAPWLDECGVFKGFSLIFFSVVLMFIFTMLMAWCGYFLLRLSHSSFFTGMCESGNLGRAYFYFKDYVGNNCAVYCGFGN